MEWALGIVLRKMGDLKGAKDLHERALKIDEKALGPDHPEVARKVNNLGLVLREMGDLKSAKKYFNRALEIRRKYLGEDHPYTRDSRNCLDSIK